MNPDGATADRMAVPELQLVATDQSPNPDPESPPQPDDAGRLSTYRLNLPLPAAIGVTIVMIVLAALTGVIMLSSRDAAPAAPTVPAVLADPAPEIAAVPPTAEEAAAQVAAPTDTVTVYVTGLVAEPGVHSLPLGARVIDAIAASGGALPDADTVSINFAQPVTDGEHIILGPHGDGSQVTGSGTSGAAAGAAAGQGLINVNTADATQLQSLPGIGPVTAAAIIAHRESSGAFRSVDELVAVRGIGPATLAQLRDAVTV